MAASQKTILHFSMEMGTLINTYKLAFPCIKKSDQQLRGYNFLMVDVCNTKKLLV